MRSINRFIALLAAALLLLTPMTVLAASHHSSTTCTKRHSLPKATGGLNVIFSFGVSGGNIRPWNATIYLDGSVKSSGIAVATQRIPDAKYTLKSLLNVADDGGFFSMKSKNPCTSGGSLPNPDMGSRNIAITTSQGTKAVSVTGSCESKFSALYDLLVAITGAGH